MAQDLLLPGGIVAMSGDAAERLLAHGDGDAALCYLALLRGDDRERARRALRWTDERLSAALDALCALGLADGQSAPPPQRKPEPVSLPDYSSADISGELQGASPFAKLVPIVEGRLGKLLSPADLKTLFTVYDYLALPAEVILILVNWCIEETERKYGKGRRPKLSQIKKEAFVWQAKGVDTVEAAESYLKQQAALRTRLGRLTPLLGIAGRPLIAREQEYISAWMAWGFDDAVIQLAYEKTVMKKQTLNWAYMNSILKSWSEKGLYSLDQIAAADSAHARKTAAAVQPGASRAADALRGDVEWLQQFASKEDG